MEKYGDFIYFIWEYDDSSDSFEFGRFSSSLRVLEKFGMNLVPWFTIKKQFGILIEDYQIVQTNRYQGFHYHGGTPSDHPFEIGIFHEFHETKCDHFMVSPFYGKPHMYLRLGYRVRYANVLKIVAEW